MNVRRTVQQSLRLLSSRDQRKLLLATLFQVSTSLLDLLGVLLLGLLGALAVTTVQGLAPPRLVESLAGSFGLGDWTPQQLLAAFAMCAAAVLLLKSLLSSLLLRRVFRFLASRQAAVSARLTEELLSRSLTLVQSRSSQETSYALIQGAGTATLVVLGQAVIAISEAALLLVLAGALLIVNPVVAVVSILFFAAVAMLLHLSLGSWATRSGYNLARLDIASLDAIQEALKAYREITVANRRTLYVERIQGLRWQAASISADVQFVNALPKYIFEVALVVGGFLLAGFLYATQDSVTATATLALFLAAATRVMPSLLRLQGAVLILRGAGGASAATFELAAELTAPSVAPLPLDRARSTSALPRRVHEGFEPTVYVEQVDFAYDGAPAACISNLSLSIPAGTSLAIVGASGAGKSTLADLLLGVLKPQGGDVRIGGLSPHEAVERWPGSIAYVPQDVVLSNATVRANVALGLPTDAIDDEWVWDALDRAHLSEFLGGERDGLDTLIGERGVRLSGGQRQRLGIARALYTNPRLLILDEATSALDAETEVAIGETVKSLEGDVTTVIIAHRLSTVRDADQIVYLEEGQAVAQGTFREVRAQVPSFDRQARIMGLV